MKTKLLCIMVLVVISIFGLVGCGEKQPQNTPVSSTEQGVEHVGVIQGDKYINEKANLQFILPESWEFIYDSPECDMSATSDSQKGTVRLGYFAIKKSEYSAEDTKLALYDLSASVASMLFDKNSTTVTDITLPISFDSAFAQEITGTVMQKQITQILFYGQTGDSLVHGVITASTPEEAQELLEHFSNISS